MVTAKSAGSGIGAFFNNPGIIGIALVIGGLFIFREPIQKAISNLAGGIGGLFSTSGPIFGAGQEAGQFVFNIGQDVGGAIFDAGAAAGQSVFDAGAAFGDFVGSTQNQIDQQLKNFFDSQKADFDLFLQQSGQNLEDIGEGFVDTGQFVGDAAQKAAEEGGPLTGIFDLFNNVFNPQQDPFQGPAIDPGSGEFTGIPFTGPLSELDTPLSLFDFANQFNITPSEAFGIKKTFGGLDFEKIAAIPTFGEILAENPNLTASQIADLKFQQAGGGGDFDFGTNTGSALEVAELNFGQGSQDIELQKALEAFKASFNPVFQGGSNFGNPGFAITAGEAFLGKTGDIVSSSLFPLTAEQQKDFLEGKGFL